jgi:hypothetical protein
MPDAGSTPAALRTYFLVQIRPDPVPGGAPRGIFQQIGVELPPL